MNCPNCGKEALNVNGRYVCLDCGIEITAAGAPATYSQPEQIPSLKNHTPEPQASAEVPQTALAPNVVQAPPSEVPAEQNLPPNPSTEPIKEYYQNAMSQSPDSSTGLASEPAEPVQSNGVVPDFPAMDTQEATQVSEMQTVPASAGTIPENPIPKGPIESLGTTEIAPDAVTETHSELRIPEPVDQVPPTSVPYPVDNFSAVPIQENNTESYFQPATMAVTSSGEMPVPATLPTEGSPPAVLSPTPESNQVASQSEATTAATAPAADTIAPVEENVPLETAPSLMSAEAQNSALNQSSPVMDTVMSSEPTIVMPPEEPEPVFTSQNSQSSIPGTSNMPTAESVFGDKVNEDNSEDLMKQKGAGLKKFLKFLFVILLTVAILGGIVWGVVYFLNQRSSGTTSTVDSGKILETSQAVAGKMDFLSNVTNYFEQSFDFSKATPKAVEGNEKIQSDLALFFSSPVLLKGSWAVNAAEDKKFEGEIYGKADKRIYIKQEDSTYTYSADTSAWVKTPGMLIASVPYVCPLDSRGSLFYSRKIENFTDEITEEIDGKSYKKIKIVPKTETIQEMLTAVNPTLFTDIKYETVSTDGIVLYAWIDEENRIYKVTVAGEINVNSNYYQGPVTVNISGTYSYDAVTIGKP